MSRFLVFVTIPIFLLITLSSPQFISSKHTGFSLKLIHRDSLESPLHPGNVNFNERIQKYIKISEARTSHLMLIETYNKTILPDAMRPELIMNNFLYLVKVSLGTPSNDYFLMLDTGADLSWIQCKPCQNCFNQKYPIFDPANSTSYVKVPCGNPLCVQFYKCENEECVYASRYADNSTTQGTLSWEAFNFPMKDGSRIVYHNLLFGCSHSSQGFETKQGDMGGLFAMNLSPSSFIFQSIANRFSYCFVNPMMRGTKSYLKFGDDIGFIGGDVKTTSFVKHPNSYLYGLNLQDISINDKRMNFPPNTFQVKPDGEGGCIIDSGTVLTPIISAAFEILRSELDDYFAGLKLEEYLDCPLADLICYHMPADFHSFPSMTYHFQGADLKIEPEHSFIINRQENYFAFAITASDEKTILGAWQQQNLRFIYDLSSNALSFVPENCAEDSG